MKRIVFYSGGIGSWYTAKRVIDKYGKDNVVLLFTDTLIEDEDLYRFLIESCKHFFNKEKGINRFLNDIKRLPRITPKMTDDDWELRATILKNVAMKITNAFPNVKWTSDGRTPWEVFKDVRWLGNSRLAQCSHLLKQKAAEEWIKEHYQPDECTLYLGIDWTEEHRKASPVKNWVPYKVEFPMCEEPYVTKDEMLMELKNRGIEVPLLYKLGFSHNNCSGLCVRAGQAHFINLLKTMPDRFEWIEKYEKEMQEYLDREVTILTRIVKGERQNLSLEQLRKEFQSNNFKQLDLFDFGGCGCFVNYA